MATVSHRRHRRPNPARPEVYVWELPVRLIHWVIVLSLIVLSFTGIYILDPFLPGGGTTGNPGFTMGWMMFVHEVTGFVFTAAVLLRVYWAFAGNRFAHWRALLPLTRYQRHDLRETLRFYTLRRRHSPPTNGHNPLAALAYIFVYMMFVMSILSGFGLFAWVSRIPAWETLFGWTYNWLSMPELRLIHVVLMFLFGAFTIHHIYSAVLVDLDERSGELSSIITGYKSDTMHEVAPDPERPQ